MRLDRDKNQISYQKHKTHEPNIKIFYHVAQMGRRFESILHEQIDSINVADIQHVEYIWVNIATDNKDVKKIRDDIESRLNYDVKFSFSHINQYEYPTLIHLYDNIKPRDYVLYFHTKGVSAKRASKIRRVDRDRHRMCEFCITDWKECVRKLKHNYDICGSKWRTLEYVEKKRRNGKERFHHQFIKYAHPPGNFWWSHYSYIKMCKKTMLTDWLSLSKKNRWWAETFIATGKEYPITFTQK